MPDWTVVPLLLFAGWLLGWAALRALTAPADRAAMAWIERHFATIALGVLIIGWIALLLAEVGVFSLLLVVAFWVALLVAFAALAARREQAALPPASQPSSVSFLGLALPARLELFLVGLWLIAAIWLFFRPHERITGAADAGVYVNTAAHIAQEGAILVDDETLATLDPALYPALLRARRAGEGTPYYLFPGFNVVATPPGRIIPDFLHLHPVWQAVAYALSGVEAALLMTGLWTLLGSVAVYLTLRQITGWPTALLALVGLTVNALQVWFARYAVTEALTQFLLWTAVWALSAWLAERRPQRLWGLIGGLALGEVFLTRIDTLFLLAVPVVAGLWLLWRRQLGRRHAWFFVPIALLATQTLFHGYFISAPYFYRISYYVERMLVSRWPLLAAGAIAAGITVLLVFRLRTRGASFARWQTPLLAGFAALIVALALYGWFVRPIVGATITYREWYDGQLITLTDRENLLHLAWYLSPFGVWLGVAGIALLTLRLNRRSVLLVSIGLFFSLLYLWRIQATPHQIYAMRRYVPMTVPFFVSGGAIFLGWLADRRRWWWRAGALLLICLWLGGFAWSARGFISQVDLRGVSAEIAQLAMTLGEDSVVLFNEQTPISRGDLLGTPLHYLHGIDVYTLRQPDAAPPSLLRAQLEQWQREGKAVYWVGDVAFLDQHALPYTPLPTVTIPYQHMEATFDRKPTRVYAGQWELPLARLTQ